MTQAQKHVPPTLEAPAPLTAAAIGSHRTAAIVASPRSSGRIYALAWIAAGLLSAGYVATIIRQPDAVSDLVMRPDTPSSNVNRLAQSVARTEADVQVLKHAVTSLQGGLIDVKARADAADQRERQIVERVGAVETRVEQFAVASIATPTPPARQAAAPIQPTPAPVALPQVVTQPKQSVQATKSATAPTIINQKQVKTIETASIPSAGGGARDLAEQRQSPPVNAAAALADASHGVIVASGPSVDALRLSWSLLSDRHKAALGRMEPRVVTTDGNTFQLVAGPLPSDTEAAKVCATLKARGIACRPSQFKGDALQ